MRLLDLNSDGFLDVVVGNDELRQTRIWIAAEAAWVEQRLSHAIRAGGRKRRTSAPMPTLGLASERVIQYAFWRMRPETIERLDVYRWRLAGSRSFEGWPVDRIPEPLARPSGCLIVAFVYETWMATAVRNCSSATPTHRRIVLHWDESSGAWKQSPCGHAFDVDFDRRCRGSRRGPAIRRH